MNRKWMLMLTSLFLALIIGLTSTGTPSLARSATPGDGPAAPAAIPAPNVGSSFTYQGRLSNSGSPANGLYDLRFTMFDFATGGTQIGPVATVLSQTVTNGLFTVTLNFGDVFHGQTRWLEIAVRPTGNGSYTTLTPRQALTAVPYALGLMPGTTISSALGFPILSIVNTFDPNVNYGVGVQGESQSAAGRGVQGLALNGTSALGVIGWASAGIGTGGGSSTGYGVVGQSGSGPGIGGQSTSQDGVQGFSSGAGRSGVYGQGQNGNYGVAARSMNPNGNSVSLYADISQGTAIYGHGIDNSLGVFGQSDYTNGVQGISNGSITSGVYGQNNAGGYGVAGRTTGSGAAVFGDNPSSGGYAGYFRGNVTVLGSLSKGGGSFKIDDPVDPANKYLYHSFVESPDMMNIYNGNVTTDAAGNATVTMPGYFQALNQDFRYQLTVIGQFAQAIVGSEIKDNHFSIKTDKPNVKVSWQVTGIRHDAYADAHRIPVEEDKAPADRGKYLYPTEARQPATLSITSGPAAAPQTALPVPPPAQAPAPLAAPKQQTPEPTGR